MTIMKNISSQDYYIPYEQMIAIREKGQLNFGIDRLTGQHLTNNQAVLQLADDPVLLKATWKAHNFWTYLMLGAFCFTIYLSLTGIWWFFIVGFLGMGVLNPILVKSHEESLLDVLVKDRSLYEAMVKAKRLNFLVEESILQDIKVIKTVTEPVVKTKLEDISWGAIGDFGKLMEETDTAFAYYDYSMLPASKITIADSLINAHNEETNKDNKGVYIQGLYSLARFQPDVGDTPIRGFPELSKISDENGTEHQIEAIAEEIEKLDSSNRFKELKEISSKEMESYLKKLNK
jgi:hypothetical protein